jgi:hypothetical protein
MPFISPAAPSGKVNSPKASDQRGADRRALLETHVATFERRLHAGDVADWQALTPDARMVLAGCSAFGGPRSGEIAELHGWPLDRLNTARLAAKGFVLACAMRARDAISKRATSTLAMLEIPAGVGKRAKGAAKVAGQ